MKLHDIEVELFTENGEQISEYGYTKENNQASSFVPSITNLAFYIRIKVIKEAEIGNFPWEHLHVAVYADKGEGLEDPHSRDSVFLLSRTIVPSAIIRGRKALDQYGRLVEQKWMFVEKDLSEAFNSLTVSGHNSGGAGKITLVFHPVQVLGYNRNGYKYPSLEEFKNSEINPQLSHAIGYGDAKIVPLKQNCVMVKSERPEHIPYAMMTFYYRPIEELQRMGIFKTENLDLSNSVDQIIAQLWEKLVLGE